MPSSRSAMTRRRCDTQTADSKGRVNAVSVSGKRGGELERRRVSQPGRTRGRAKQTATRPDKLLMEHEMRGGRMDCSIE